MDNDISNLAEKTIIEGTDYLPLVDNSGTPTTKKITIADLYAAISFNFNLPTYTLSGLTYKSIDVMKKTKDALTNQLSSAQKINLIACLKTAGITHIAICVPMDTTAQYTAAGSTPSPRTVEAETQDWCDKIHAVGLNVIHRGSFGGVENIWGIPFDDAVY